ncbi:conjugal transfer protein TrbH [Pleomorphomonas koreensis]|uniref:conjugal transfer protein TrbH n=1 Tax=Pleomorphomonas koreensis TaxID=257440 RepID=UPI0005695652|nr:conjugal transfer protein TrbH [Pleomorphomonas koreensis]
MTTCLFVRPLFARTLVVVMAAALVSGCAGLGLDAFGTSGVVASTAPTEMTTMAASAIAGDLVPRLAEQLGQGKAIIVLKPDSSAFGAALEAALRTWGFAVTMEEKVKDQSGIRLAYVVAPVDGQILVRFSTSSLEIGRIYATSGTGAIPASPISVMQRG